ncbi:hypothetical protein ACFVRR_23475 [Gottfriedia sp. NPDC057948]|uniref:hypothetical protein n=1 Tax=Gottfriedia sp. NPDC057948 TaxID=3346287 RepID=UPI0036D85DC0
MSRKIEDILGIKRSTGIRFGRANKKLINQRTQNTTHLSEKSTSKMSRNIEELNNKVMKYINN